MEREEHPKIGIYPGSFDPVTFGHLDIIERSSQIFDRMIVGVLCNNAKKPLFSADERVKMLRSVTSHIPNVEVRAFDGLLVDFAKQVGARVVVRGLRAVTDFEYELQMAQTNHTMCPGIDTIFLTTDLRYAYLSSSTVREVAFYEGKISQFVPPEIVPLVQERCRSLREADGDRKDRQE
ncbi:MAG: pantetheine-phosphate adenylyltransferase [Lachnospiraceae bacterium]|nr:pantetheine-phosphate adenylyltransferase [Lachnospiraceae bacterium]